MKHLTLIYIFLSAADYDQKIKKPPLAFKGSLFPQQTTNSIISAHTSSNLMFSGSTYESLKGF